MGIIDRFPLTKEVFEDKVIGVGARKQQVLIIFRKTMQEMNEWCMENYGANFDTVYELLKAMTLTEWRECMKQLGEKGNPTAMAYVSSKLDEDDASGLAAIKFNVNLKMENSNNEESGS